MQHSNLRFSPYSLGDWISLCREVDIPHIPAVQITEIERDDWRKFDQDGPHQQRIAAAFAAIDRSAINMLFGPHPRSMHRWDTVADSWLKLGMARGAAKRTSDSAWSPKWLGLTLDDPRAFDVLVELRRVVIPVWRRPWVEAVMDAGFPIEYRVFVDAGHIEGISSYYPQRPLADSPERQREIGQARDMTQRLVDALQNRTPFEWPMRYVMSTSFTLERPPDPGVAFTADFLVRADDGEVVFIEGGPPYGRGAHPCCFEEGDISGVALADRNPDEA